MPPLIRSLGITLCCLPMILFLLFCSLQHVSFDHFADDRSEILDRSLLKACRMLVECLSKAYRRYARNFLNSAAPLRWIHLSRLRVFDSLCPALPDVARLRPAPLYHRNDYPPAPSHRLQITSNGCMLANLSYIYNMISYLLNLILL
jgi:hypothetical protein